MTNQKFKLKIDVYGKIFLCLPIVIALAILAIVFPEAFLSPEHWKGVILALLPYSLLVILHAMFSYASVDEDSLSCHFLSKEKTLITTQSG